MTENDALQERIAAELIAARARTTALTSAVDEADLVKQHSPLMSPLVWDLAHIANQEEKKKKRREHYAHLSYAVC